ncbi:MAG TPA: RteC domain-containing protein [Puia sp.]|nr:RteC domain-containing protein [Puia sp.]
MNKFFEELSDDLEFRLEHIHSEGEGLASIYQSIEAIKKSLLLMKSFVRDNPFENQSDEVHYYKVVAPPLYGRLFFFMKQYETRMEKQYGSQSKFGDYLQLELAKIEQFHMRHIEFCFYYIQDAKHMDDRIFVRDAAENTMLDQVEVIMAEDFCVGCYWAAQLLANMEIKRWLERQVEELKGPAVVFSDEDDMPEMVFTDGPTAAVELALALHEKGCFNNGKATLKQVIRWTERYFRIKLGNFHNTIQAIGRRKGETAKFMIELKGEVERKIEELADRA